MIKTITSALEEKDLELFNAQMKLHLILIRLFLVRLNRQAALLLNKQQPFVLGNLLFCSGKNYSSLTVHSLTFYYVIPPACAAGNERIRDDYGIPIPTVSEIVMSFENALQILKLKVTSLVLIEKALGVFKESDGFSGSTIDEALKVHNDKMTKLKYLMELSQIIIKPELIDQEKYNLCGMAVIVSYLAHKAPDILVSIGLKIINQEEFTNAGVLLASPCQTLYKDEESIIIHILGALKKASWKNYSLFGFSFTYDIKSKLEPFASLTSCREIQFILTSLLKVKEGESLENSEEKSSMKISCLLGKNLYKELDAGMNHYTIFEVVAEKNNSSKRNLNFLGGFNSLLPHYVLLYNQGKEQVLETYGFKRTVDIEALKENMLWQVDLCKPSYVL